MGFNITLVRSRIPTRPYAKVDGKYSGPTWNNNIGLQTISEDPKETLEFLRLLSDKQDTCMVMGTAIRPEIIDTDRTMQNFVEEPIRMVVFDLDKYESPHMNSEITYPEALEDAKGFVKEHLPPEFQDVTFIIRFSSSFLVKEGPYLRCHVIFLLEEAQYPREIGLWMKQEKVPADITFYFNLTQPIFTAGPKWVNIVDPLSMRDPEIPRVGIATGGSPMVRKGWQPYAFHRYEDKINIDDLPTSSQLPGKIGSFCRMVPIKKVLEYLGYTEESENRFLAPKSSTGIPGAIVFSNGFVFSHHDGDPINEVIEHVFSFKRQSLNAYDLMHGWATVHKEDPGVMKEFEFLLDQAVSGDSSYQDEVLHSLTDRAEWLEEGGYEGQNRKIIDGIIGDMHGMGLTGTTREYVYTLIKAKTVMVKLADLRSLWKNVRRDKAMQREDYDPDSNLRSMASIFKRQKIIYSHHKTMVGDFWCYFSDTRIWKRCNSTQAKAFINNHVHSSMPIKTEIDFTKMEHLTTLILRETCLSMSEFKKGSGWAFRYGKYGLAMDGLFGSGETSEDWTVSKSVKTLSKEDHIHKELPVSYQQWKDSNEYPEEYVDFLTSSCEEDMESVELLREYGGYILSDSYYLHKMLIVEGVPGCGKSVLAKIYQEMIGHQYSAAVSIMGIGGRFGLGSLPGKKLAVMSEARTADLSALRALVPILLKIVGQDYIDTEDKNVKAQTELLECKILMLANRTPVLPDDTGALSQRILMMRMDKCFRGTDQEILGLDTKILKRGVAGILKWHLTGLENLSKRKEFIEPERGIRAKRRLTEQIDPLKSFIDSFFDIDIDLPVTGCIIQSDFIRYFRAYLRRIGQNTDEDSYTRTQKRASIRNIVSLYPKVEKKRAWTADKRTWFLQGLVAVDDMEMEFVEELSAME